MPFDFGLVTRTEIGGSDLFGDIQSVLKSPTILLNSLGTPGMLVGIENNHFGKMSGIRDTCPEFRDTCPDIRKLEISCDEISDHSGFLMGNQSSLR